MLILTGLCCCGPNVPAAMAQSNQYLLSQVADGGGWRTTFSLINPSTATVNYQLQLKQDSGAPFNITAGGQTGSSFTGTLGAGASATLSSSDPATLLEGIATAQSSGPLIVSGVFSAAQPGGGVFEAAVPSVSVPEQSLLLPFDNQAGKATGVALANTGSASATVTFTFRTENGSTFYTGSMNLNGGSKTEFSLSTQFPQTQGQRGTVVMSTGSPVLTALGLRFLPGGTFTSLPVYSTGPDSTAVSRQVLSHVIDGGGWLSTITLVNLDSQPATFELQLWGTSGSSMFMTLNGATSSTFGGTIPALSSLTLITPGTSSNLLQGWGAITSSQRIRAQLMFDSFATGQPTLEAAVPAIADGQTSLAMPYDNTSGLATGIAVANSGGTAASVQLAVRNQAGAVTDNKMLSLAAGAKTSFVLTDMAPNSAGNRGLVQLVASASSISALALRFNGPAFTTLPVGAADPAAAPAAPNSGPTFTLTAKTTTAAEGTDANGSPDYCATPVTKTSFLTTDTAVGAWFTFNNAQSGNVAALHWIHPSGAVDSNQPGGPINFTGPGCLLYFLGINGSEAATEPGNWQVELFVNGSPVVTLPFTISAPASGGGSAPTISSFTADSASITAGTSTTLRWTIAGATSASINNGVGPVSATTGTAQVTPAQTTTYLLTATNSAGSVTKTTTVTVTAPPPSPPTISFFNSFPSTITAGQSSALSWSITGATSASIDNGVGAVSATSGTVVVNPPQTTTYTLTALNGTASSTKQTMLTVQAGTSTGSNGQTVTLNITNQLVYPVNFTANGATVKQVAGSSSATVAVPGTYNMQLGFSLVQPATTEGKAVGESMTGVYPALANPSGALNYTVNNVIGGQPYFVPYITNNSGVAALIGVNMGLSDQNECNCDIAASGTTSLGYYKFYSNSNVRAYSVGSGYSGSNYVYWGSDPNNPSSPAITAAANSGIANLGLSSAPGSGGSGGSGGTTGGGAGYLYSGMYSYWVNTLLQNDGWNGSTAPAQPPSTSSTCAEYDQYVDAAVASAFAAEQQAASRNSAAASQDASTMFSLLQLAYSLCSGSASVGNQACATEKIYSCSMGNPSAHTN